MRASSSRPTSVTSRRPSSSASTCASQCSSVASRRCRRRRASVAGGGSQGAAEASTSRVSRALPTASADVDAALAGTGFAVVGPDALATLCGASPAAFDAWRPFWNRLPPDAYLLDGGKYRQRRHGVFVVDGDAVAAAPHRPHWQPV